MSDEKPLVLDESRPDSFGIASGTRRVWFENPKEVPIDIRSIGVSLASQEGLRDVRELVVRSTSLMTSMWVAKYSVDVTTVRITNAKRIEHV